MPKSKVALRQFETVTGSVEETRALGERLGQVLRAGDVVALHGELGSGKTTLIQGIAQGTGRNPDLVRSPTFVLMREYAGEVPVVHIDGYRLEGAPAVAWLDTDFIFATEKITLIEWAERFSGLLPDDHLDLHLEHMSTNRRKLSIVGTGPRSQAIVDELHAQRATHDAPRTVDEESHATPGD